MLLNYRESLGARDRLESAQSFALGKALSENGDDSKVKRAVRKLTRAAFPKD